MGQILALGFVFSYLLGIDPKIGMIVGGGIVTTYAAFGGVRAVVITDVIQFSLLVIAIPIVLNFTVSKIGGYNDLITQVSMTPMPEYDVMTYGVIFLAFCIPQLYPSLMQRYLIARNVSQLRTSLNMTILTITFIYIIVTLTGTAASILYPHSDDPNNIFVYLIQELMPIGLKGLIVSGLLAVVMSTADTELNTGSIALVHDVIKKFKIKNINETRLASFLTFVLGISAILLAMQFDSIFEAILFANLLWYPVMLCPLILGIYGLKSNDKTFVTSTIITVIGLLIFHNVWSHNFALSTICGVTFNFVVFMACHYFYNHGYKFANNIKTYIEDLNKRSFSLDKDMFTSINPSYGAPYAVFGLFVIINYCFPHFMWEEQIEPFYTVSIYLRFISGIACIMLMMKDFWLPQKYFPHVWYANIIFTLPFLTSFSLWVHNIDTFWLAMMGVGLWLTSVLVDWFRCLIFTIIGMAISFVLYKSLGGSLTAIPASNIYAIFYIIAAFMAIGSIFIKRKEGCVPVRLLMKKMSLLLSKRTVLLI